MEKGDSLQHSQHPSTCPYSEPDQSSRYTPSHFQQDPLYYYPKFGK